MTRYYYLLLSLLPWQWFSFTITLYHKILELFYLWCQSNLKLQENCAINTQASSHLKTAVIVTFLARSLALHRTAEPQEALWQLHSNYQSIMPKPVYLLTVQETHKEYNSLMDQKWAKDEQLDSGEFGAVGTPAFNAEACELANLPGLVSQLCQKLNLPPPNELYRSTFNHWICLLDLNYNRWTVWLGYGGCSFVCRYVRITGLLSAPLVNLRIGDWLCILPAITLVVDKLTNPQTDWWTAKPTRQKA